MKKYKHINEKERIEIYEYLRSGYKQKEIAENLGRDPSTISREIKRNSTSTEARLNNSPRKKKIYLPINAQRKYEKNRKKSKVTYPLKNPRIYTYVIKHLTGFESWSPDSIAGRIKSDIGEKISYECIYQFIYSKRAKKMELWKHLRRGRPKRRKIKGRKVKRVLIPNRQDISLRPKKVDQRRRMGDWEGDSILGHRKGPALHTEVERLSRMLIIEKMSKKNSKEAYRAMNKIFKNLPEKLKKTTTLDNGPEHVLHEKVTKKARIQIYFAKPYSSWQRGANENANGLVRWYFPKGTDFAQVTKKQLKKVQDAINNRPRKSLNYRKPNEIFNQFLSLTSP